MNNLSQNSASLNIEGKSKIKSKEDSSIGTKTIINDSNNLNQNNSFSEVNKESKNNFSSSSNNTNVNKTNSIDINKINEYKSKISQLEEQIEKEKNNSKSKGEYGKKIQEKILNCQKEIKLYVHKNNKQREQLQELSHEFYLQLELIEF